MDCLSTGHLIIVMLYLHIRQKHILHENQVLAVRQAEVAEEASAAAASEAVWEVAVEPVPGSNAEDVSSVCYQPF